MGKKSKLKLTKEERNPTNSISVMLKTYPDDEKDLLSLFQNLDNGNGVVIKKMQDKKMRECLKIILKKLEFKKERKDGEKFYVKSEKSESLVKLLTLTTSKTDTKPETKEINIVRESNNPEEIDLEGLLEDETKRERETEIENVKKKMKIESSYLQE